MEEMENACSSCCCDFFFCLCVPPKQPRDGGVEDGLSWPPWSSPAPVWSVVVAGVDSGSTAPQHLCRGP